MKTPILKKDKQLTTATETVGGRIVTARKAAGLTQEKLAEVSGIHRQWIGRWERNRSIPSQAELNKLSAVLKFLDFEKC